jgi:hypothetical protein
MSDVSPDGTVEAVRMLLGAIPVGETRSPYGPNDTIPCPSASSRKRHWALAQRCDICGTEGRRVYLKSIRGAA